MAFTIRDVSIIIPNWNGKKLLEKHLPLVCRLTEGAEIIVVDDASADDSVLYVRENFPFIRIIPQQKQVGFSGSVNAGVAISNGALVLLLNSDIKPTQGFLNPVYELFENKKLFAVGLTDENIEKNNVMYRGRGIASFVKGMYVHRRGEVDKTDTAWVSGGSGVFRKSIWNKLGGMDTLFSPFYWEDIDLSYRALKSGYLLRFERKSVVVHKHEEGAILSNFSKKTIRSIAFRNQLFFIWKNISFRPYIVMHFMHLPLFILKSIFKGDWSIIIGFFHAILQWKQVLRAREVGKKTWIREDFELLENE